MLLKNKLFSGLGSSIEWFDFALYGFFGPIFSEIFFEHAQQKKWVALLSSYLVFAVGFAARPVGGLIFGYLGDKYGRTVSLKITPLLMTLSSILMAILPTYKSIGSAAIVLLVSTRVFQGISIGGEFVGNVVYLCESSSRWKYVWGSIGSCSGCFGIIIASTIASLFYLLFSHSFMYEYGWRIAFLCSVPLGIFAFLIRLNMLEIPGFDIKTSCKNPITLSIKHHKKLLLLCVGLVYLHASGFYFVFIFLPIFLNKFRHFTEGTALLHNTAFLFIHLCCIPVFGLIVSNCSA